MIIMNTPVIAHEGIPYIIGDMVKTFCDSPIDIIAHQTNCCGVMGSGIAKAIAEEWNSVEQEDKEYCLANDGDVAGTVLICDIPGGWVANLYGQLLPGRNTDYNYLKASLKSLRRAIMTSDQNLVVGLPLIGCGVGGGDWSIVSEIIKEELDDLEFYVFVLNDTVFNKVVVV